MTITSSKLEKGVITIESSVVETIAHELVSRDWVVTLDYPKGEITLTCDGRLRATNEQNLKTALDGVTDAVIEDISQLYGQESYTFMKLFTEINNLDKESKTANARGLMRSVRFSFLDQLIKDPLGLGVVSTLLSSTVDVNYNSITYFNWIKTHRLFRVVDNQLGYLVALSNRGKYTNVNKLLNVPKSLKKLLANGYGQFKTANAMEQSAVYKGVGAFILELVCLPYAKNGTKEYRVHQDYVEHYYTAVHTGLDKGVAEFKHMSDCLDKLEQTISVKDAYVHVLVSCLFANILDEIKKVIPDDIYEDFFAHPVSSLQGTTSVVDSVIMLKHKYNLDLARVLEYTLVILPESQGHPGLTSSLDIRNYTYRDYLNMSSKISDKYIKYPTFLATRHDIVARNYVLVADDEKSKKVSAVQEKYAFLEEQSIKVKEEGSKSKEFTFKLASSSTDIVEEGNNMSHCVASYVDRVADGKCLIGFIRSADEPDKSLLTIELHRKELKEGTYGFSITQASAFANARPQGDSAQALAILRQNLAKKSYNYARTI